MVLKFVSNSVPNDGSALRAHVSSAVNASHGLLSHAGVRIFAEAGPIAFLSPSKPCLDASTRDLPREDWVGLAYGVPQKPITERHLGYGTTKSLSGVTESNAPSHFVTKGGDREPRRSRLLAHRAGPA